MSVQPTPRSAREAAHCVLTLIFEKGYNLDDALRQGLIASKQTKEKAVIQALVYGVLRHAFWLDAVLLELLAKPLKAKRMTIKWVLFISLFELKAQQTPDYAIINEGVALCAWLKQSWASKLVNAILRRYTREQEQITQRVQGLESRYNHPLWLIKQTQQDWPKAWESILHENLNHPPMHLRVNTQRTDVASYLDELTQGGIDAVLSPLSTVGITLKKPTDVALLPHFKAGHVSVQDVAAQMAAKFIDLAPHARVLDACAAPGGKTAHMLETEPTLAVSALDISPKRASIIDDNLQRLGLRAKCLVADANALEKWWDGVLFDRILLDAPCSATGVIRRHPDILHLRRQDDIAALHQKQFALLTHLWPALKPGGILLYATCSVLKHENDAVIEKFLATVDSASSVDLSCEDAISTAYGVQFLPKQFATDGFYYAKLLKSES